MKRLISAICVLFFLLPLSAQETYQKETFISSGRYLAVSLAATGEYEKE